MVFRNLWWIAAPGSLQSFVFNERLSSFIRFLWLALFSVWNLLLEWQLESTAFLAFGGTRILQTPILQRWIGSVIPIFHACCRNEFTIGDCYYNSRAGYTNQKKARKKIKSVPIFRQKTDAITHVWSRIGAKLERVAV